MFACYIVVLLVGTAVLLEQRDACPRLLRAHRRPAPPPSIVRPAGHILPNQGSVPKDGEVVIAPASPRRVIGAHPRLVDAALATLVGAIGLLSLLFGRWPDGVQPSSADAVAAAAALLLLPARRRAPLPVLALAVLGEVAFTVHASYPSQPLKLAALIAVYTVARRVRRRTALIAASGTALSLYGAIACATDSASSPEAGAMFAWTGMFAAVGATVRTWNDYVAAMEERALRAEASKEEEARRRVTVSPE